MWNCLSRSEESREVLVKVKNDGETQVVTNALSCRNDPDALAAKALEVVKDPDAHRPIGERANQLIESRYSLHQLVPQMQRMYEQALEKRA